MGSLTTYWFKEDEEFQEREPVLIYDEIDLTRMLLTVKLSGLWKPFRPFLSSLFPYQLAPGRPAPS